MNSQTEPLHELVRRSDALLLDFDGPVCGVFAGDPSPRIALGITRTVESMGVEVPAELREHSMELLAWVDTLDTSGLTETVDNALITAEVGAVQTASQTPFAREVIEAAHQAGKRVAVVSNNSADSISAYLRAQNLDEYVWPIVGRPYANPSEMKPNPAPLLRAAAALEIKPESCVFVGDSAFDIEAGVAANVPVIGYANRPHKLETLAEAGASVLITSMGDLVPILQDCSSGSQGTQ